GLDLGITELGSLLHPSASDPSGQIRGDGGQNYGNGGTGPTTFPSAGGFTAGLGPAGFSQRTPWNFKWYPREGQVNTSVRPPAKWKIAVCSAALIGELGFFLAIELPEMGRRGEHNP